MQIRLMIEGQENVQWEDWLALARAAEAAQLDGLFRSDHYTSFHGEPGAALDAWSTITALAPLTQRIRLGTLVSPVTFRHPSVLARMVASADQISGGRIEVGLGAGWFEPEHLQNGFAFPDMRTRMDLLEEQLQVLVRSWSGERFDFRGRHYTLRGQRALPKPQQAPHPPIIMGGQGKPRSVQLAVTYANEYNTLASSVEQCRELRRTLDDACRQAGRDPATLRLSVMALGALGTSDAAAQARFERALNCAPSSRDSMLKGMNKFIGSVATVAAAAREYEKAGVSRLYLNHFDRRDLEGVALMGELARAVG
jgi:F420-dependent oxidoreductase-like protein